MGHRAVEESRMLLLIWPINTTFSKNKMFPAKPIIEIKLLNT